MNFNLGYSCRIGHMQRKCGMGDGGGRFSSPRLQASRQVLPAEVGLRNGTISFGALGAARGLAPGLSGGPVGRSVPLAIVGSFFGLLLGGAAGAGLSQVISRSGDVTWA